jgi:threonine 3-dehydrogenase
MKALVKLKPEPGIWMQDIDIPAVGHNDILVKIHKTAICGTDVHIYNWDKWARQTVPVPLVTGHEFVGEVVDMGSEVSGFSVGDRVSGEGHITCGVCRQCRAGKRHLCRNTLGIGVTVPGCFAEYLRLPAFNAFRLPDSIPDSIGAILDPFGNAAHTALSFDMVGEDVLITGAGPIGIMAAAIARHAGARHVAITDINEYRLELASKMGVTRAVNVSRQTIGDVMQDLDMSEGFDIGLEMSGNPTALKGLIGAMMHGGHIGLLGIFPDDIALNLNDVVFKGLFIKGIYGREMFETWYKMSSMLQSGLDISAVITHNSPVEEYEQAFEIMRSGQSGKVILDWTG